MSGPIRLNVFIAAFISNKEVPVAKCHADTRVPHLVWIKVYDLQLLDC